MPRLFVSDFRPNGTHDLVILHKNGSIDIIEEAVFGFRFKSSRFKYNKLIGFNNYENSGLVEFTADDGEFFTQVFEVCIEDILPIIATSPVDPFGYSVLRQLMKFNII